MEIDLWQVRGVSVPKTLETCPSSYESALFDNTKLKQSDLKLICRKA